MVTHSDKTLQPEETHPFEFHPLTPERREDLERLFGPRGACGGCWCMSWRREKRSDFEAQKGGGNRLAFKELVDSGHVPGILAYAGGQPVGWCSTGPRDSFPFLGRSRTLGPVDDHPVWSVSCFFVAKGFRHQGLSTRLVRAAADYAKRRGATVVEGYPVISTMGEMPAAFAWTGLAGTFVEAGFTEVLRRSKSRPIMRLYLAGSDEVR